MTSSFNDLGASSNSEASVLQEAVTQDAQTHDTTPTRNKGEHQLTGLDALPTDEFLRIVGLRVRTRRSTLSMSRKRLAEVSGVSERYLAQLESGQGNMSIALLRKVTTAIGVTMGALLSAEMSEESPQPTATATSNGSHIAVSAKPCSASTDVRHSGQMGSANGIVRNSRLVT